MKISYNWLQTYFEAPLPSPEMVAEALTFHSSEIEEVAQIGDDTVFDIKVLPDKSAWLLSHRGVAKELSVILDIPLADDPLRRELEDIPKDECIEVTITTPVCDYYSALLIEGVTVGPSPDWLQTRLEAVGQKSINTIVDITNYVMLSTGQPLHAFDAEKLQDGHLYKVGVRSAKEGEVFTSLTEEEYILRESDTVIVDGNDTAIGLAGVKGGLNSGVTSTTTRIILEAAHFDRVAVRRTAQHHRLQTDASKRYENGVSRHVVPFALSEAVAMCKELLGATIVGCAMVGDNNEVRPSVTVRISRINAMLGTTLSLEQIKAILSRFDYVYTIQDDEIIVTPPFERDDITIEADMVEEIGRMYGLENIVSIPPQKATAVAVNKRHYYAEIIRTTLTHLGFSEVYTSSFCQKDIVPVKNALASDKGYLRSALTNHLDEARGRNIPHRDLLGITAVKIFEIGTVFQAHDEDFSVGIAVQTGTVYAQKIDEPLWRNAIEAIELALGVRLTVTENKPGIVSFSLQSLLDALPSPATYASRIPLPKIAFQPFSIYPSVSRDIAMWVGDGTGAEEVAATLRTVAGPLLVRLTHLDTFTNNEGRTSVAFRMVFQSYEKTLDGSDVDICMRAVNDAVKSIGCEVR
jgi:phenylalanyl-tRNA synthetase beta chain